MYEPEEENRAGLPPDVEKTKAGGLTSTQDVAYTNDSSMTRLYSKAIPTSDLAPAAGVTQTATDGCSNTATTHTAAVYAAPSADTNAQSKTACCQYERRSRKVAEWGTATPSPRSYDKQAGNITFAFDLNLQSFY